MTQESRPAVDTRLRYGRQITLLGEAGQQQLAAARVLVIGAGGLGNPAALYLATSGVGHMVINDFDTVDASNLPRQVLFRETHLGQPKATVLAAQLRSANPQLQVTAIDTRLEHDELAERIAVADAVLDCTDNFRSRWLLSELCVAARKPLITAAAIRFEGQLAVFRHDRSASPCYRCLYSEADENLNDCAGQGVLASVVGTVGCMQATETIKVLLGMESALAGKVWLYDGRSGESRLLGVKPRSDCPVCGVSAAPGNTT